MVAAMFRRIPASGERPIPIRTGAPSRSCPVQARRMARRVAVGRLVGNWCRARSASAANVTTSSRHHRPGTMLRRGPWVRLSPRRSIMSEPRRRSLILTLFCLAIAACTAQAPGAPGSLGVSPPITAASASAAASAAPSDPPVAPDGSALALTRLAYGAVHRCRQWRGLSHRRSRRVGRDHRDDGDLVPQLSY